MRKLIGVAVLAVLVLGFSARAQKGVDTDSPQLLVDDRETVLKIPHDWHLSIYGMTLDYSAKTISIGGAPTVVAPCTTVTIPSQPTYPPPCGWNTICGTTLTPAH